MSSAECIARAGCGARRLRARATRLGERERETERGGRGGGRAREPRNNEADLSVTQESEPGFRWPCTRI